MILKTKMMSVNEYYRAVNIIRNKCNLMLHIISNSFDAVSN